MTGPELDQNLEAIGRRLSPRLGHALDSVVTRATATPPERPRRPRLALSSLHRLGGPALTVTVTAAFAAVLAIGVANHPATPGSSDGTPAASGPAVALATSTARPAATRTPAGGPATPPPASAPASSPPAVAPPAPSQQVTSGGPFVPTTPTGNPGPATSPTPPPAQTGPAPRQTAMATTPPSSAPAPTPAAQPTPAPTPSGGPISSKVEAGPSTPAPTPTRIVLTQQDSGRTITVHPGDVVEVELAGAGDGSHWSEPQSSTKAVLQRTSGGTGKDGSSSAVFTAGSAGTAKVTASRPAACSGSGPCPTVVQGFQVTVVVTRSGG